MGALKRKVKSCLRKIQNAEARRRLGLPETAFIDAAKSVHNIKCGDHCSIYAANSFIVDSEFGDCSYIGDNSYVIGLKVGKFSCLGPYLRMAVGEHPTKQIVSIHPAFFSVSAGHRYTFVKKQKFNEFKHADGEFHFVIGNDVWIGSNVLLLEGHKIGDGAIVGAGSVVTKDIPPYEIWGGSPARFIRKRFTDEHIGQLLKIKWWDWPIKEIKSKADTFEDIDTFLANLADALSIDE